MILLAVATFLKNRHLIVFFSETIRSSRETCFASSHFLTGRLFEIRDLLVNVVALISSNARFRFSLDDNVVSRNRVEILFERVDVHLLLSSSRGPLAVLMLILGALDIRNGVLRFGH